MAVHLGVAVAVGLAVKEKPEVKIIEVSFGEGKGKKSGSRSSGLVYKQYVAKISSPTTVITKKINTNTVIENKISLPASSTATASSLGPNTSGSGSGEGSGSGPGLSGGSGSNDPMAKYVGVIHKLVSNKKRYPVIAQRLRQQGVVVLKVKLNKAGQLLNVEVVEPSKYKSLTDASVDAIKNIPQFPAIPNEIKMDEISFNIPFDYRPDTF
jgi:TonB family protein